MQVLRDIPFNRTSFQHLYHHSWQNPAFAQVLLLKTPSKTSTSIPVHLIRAPDISEKVVQMAAELLPQLPVNPFLVNHLNHFCKFFSVISNLLSVVHATANCFRFATFPWVTLTPTDKHVLSSTDKSVVTTFTKSCSSIVTSFSSLRSPDPSLVVCACEFLSDVVFQDFPAEVFLQRPFMIKVRTNYFSCFK
jgi:hypothetical protein